MNEILNYAPRNIENKSFSQSMAFDSIDLSGGTLKLTNTNIIDFAGSIETHLISEAPGVLPNAGIRIETAINDITITTPNDITISSDTTLILESTGNTASLISGAHSFVLDQTGGLSTLTGGALQITAPVPTLANDTYAIWSDNSTPKISQKVGVSAQTDNNIPVMSGSLENFNMDFQSDIIAPIQWGPVTVNMKWSKNGQFVHLYGGVITAVAIGNFNSIQSITAFPAGISPTTGGFIKPTLVKTAGSANYELGIIEITAGQIIITLASGAQFGAGACDVALDIEYTISGY